MKKRFIVLILMSLFLTSYMSKNDSSLNNSTKLSYQPIASYIINNQKSRIKDSWGKGQFGESRDKGKRTHQGLDIVSTAGEKVFAPFEGNIVREAVPYKNDKSYRGVVLKGTGDWAGYEIKMFYVEGLFSGKATKGQRIGTAQNLTTKYPGITNHIHVEVKKGGSKIDPFEIWQMSF